MLLPPTPAFLLLLSGFSVNKDSPGLHILFSGLPHYTLLEDVAVPRIDVRDKLFLPSRRAWECGYNWSYWTLCTLLACAIPNHLWGAEQSVQGGAISPPHRPHTLGDWSQVHQVWP